VNCIDCLDRTNVAQYCIGKVVLKQQLRCLGAISDSRHALFPEVAEVLQKMYAEHGDRIAQQYGGSGAMHKDALSEKDGADSSDPKKASSASGIAQNALVSIKRYYNNNFTDQDKQAAINVFLGNYIPAQDKTPIWYDSR